DVVVSELSSDSESSGSDHKARSAAKKKLPTRSARESTTNMVEKAASSQPKKKNVDHDWDIDPELFGIRRSGRTRQDLFVGCSLLLVIGVRVGEMQCAALGGILVVVGALFR
ncbi:hypothetical protein SARC_14890, partial [Sphaeroforma arctica JP610]